MAGKVRDIDRGWADYERMMFYLDGLSLTVGIHEDAENAPELAMRLLVNEFGTTDGHIPERAAVRTWFEANLGFFDQVRRVLRSAKTASFAEAALRALSKDAENSLRAAIEAWDTPENAESTVKRKGFNNPLIHTRDTVNAISAKIARRAD